MLTISTSQYATLLNLDFNIGSHTYSMIPNAQMWHRSLNSNFGGNSDTIYLTVISVSYLMDYMDHATDGCIDWYRLW
jgi:hypothetical protein